MSNEEIGHIGDYTAQPSWSPQPVLVSRFLFVFLLTRSLHRSPSPDPLPGSCGWSRKDSEVYTWRRFLVAPRPNSENCLEFQGFFCNSLLNSWLNSLPFPSHLSGDWVTYCKLYASCFPVNWQVLDWMAEVSTNSWMFLYDDFKNIAISHSIFFLDSRRLLGGSTQLVSS